MMSPPGAESPAARRQVAEAILGRAVHPAVPDALEVSTLAQERAREALCEGLAVVTGQQAGFLGGPLYTVYKAAAAIVDARALSAELGRPVAPVFWLQDEDHDFDEIRTAGLTAADGSWLEVALPPQPEAEGVSVAWRRVPPEVAACHDAVAAALEGRPHADAVMALHREAWQPGASVSGAFRVWLERLFAPHGLLVVDPMHPALVDAARPLHDEALARRVELAETLQAQAEALSAAGRAVPVHVRPGAPLSFFHPDGPRGPRHRVAAEGDGLAWVGREGSVDVATLTGLHATTSALLRPLLQDLLLPTAAYVGGPGERAYLQQLPPLWAAFGRPMPMVVPRAGFRWVDTVARKRLRQLGLDAADLDGDVDALLARLAGSPEGWPDPDGLPERLQGDALAALQAFADAVGDRDPGLARSAARVARAYRYHAERLADRYRRTLVREDDVLKRRMEDLTSRLRPGGRLQERTLCAAPALAAVGIDAFVQAVLDAVVPFDGTLRDLEVA